MFPGPTKLHRVLGAWVMFGLLVLPDIGKHDMAGKRWIFN